MVTNLAQYKGKRVVVTRNLEKPNADGHSAEEVEGTAVEGNDEIGLLVKPKGKTMVELIKTPFIEKVDVVPTVLKVFKAKSIKPVTPETVRQHLIDKHGFALTLVNSADEERAMKIHDQIDHSDLGHNHDAENQQQAEAA